MSNCNANDVPNRNNSDKAPASPSFAPPEDFSAVAPDVMKVITEAQRVEIAARVVEAEAIEFMRAMQRSMRDDGGDPTTIIPLGDDLGVAPDACSAIGSVPSASGSITPIDGTIPVAATATVPTPVGGAASDNIIPLRGMGMTFTSSGFRSGTAAQPELLKGSAAFTVASGNSATAQPDGESPGDMTPDGTAATPAADTIPSLPPETSRSANVANAADNPVNPVTSENINAEAPAENAQSLPSNISAPSAAVASGAQADSKESIDCPTTPASVTPLLTYAGVAGSWFDDASIPPISLSENLKMAHDNFASAKQAIFDQIKQCVENIHHTEDLMRLKLSENISPQGAANRTQPQAQDQPTEPPVGDPQND